MSLHLGTGNFTHLFSPVACVDAGTQKSRVCGRVDTEVALAHAAQLAMAGTARPRASDSIYFIKIRGQGCPRAGDPLDTS